MSGIIWEAFKPQTDFRRERPEDEEEAPKTEERKVERREESSDEEFREREGGIY